MAMQESGEMYLETIYILSQKSDYVRAIDVGNHMGYSKPSVSRALGILKNDGLITVGDSGHLELTKKGLSMAKKIHDRTDRSALCICHPGRTVNASPGGLGGFAETGRLRRKREEAERRDRRPHSA